MDEQVTSTNLETTQNNETGSAAAASADHQEALSPEKVSSLQKFLSGLFGKKDDEEAEAANGSETTETAAATEKEKSLTEADLEAAVESAKKKWQEEQAEADRVKKLSPEELAQEEQQKRDKELETLRGQLLQRDLKEQAVAALDKKDFPVKLAENLDYSSKESMEASLKNTMDVFEECLKAAIQTRLKGKTPEGLGGAASAENMIKDQIAKNIRGGMI